MKAKSVRVTPRRRRLIVSSLLGLMVMCNSCEITRVITTQCESSVRDDKNIIIQTKTIETYNGKKQI